MTRDKKHEKKKPAPWRTHSKRTGAIILIALAVLCVLFSVFFVLAHLENMKFEIILNNYLGLSCEDMRNTATDPWQYDALKTKDCP